MNLRSSSLSKKYLRLSFKGRSSSIYKKYWGCLPFTKNIEVVFHLQKKVSLSSILKVSSFKLDNLDTLDTSNYLQNFRTLNRGKFEAIKERQVGVELCQAQYILSFYIKIKIENIIIKLKNNCLNLIYHKDT